MGRGIGFVLVLATSTAASATGRDLEALRAYETCVRTHYERSLAETNTVNKQAVLGQCTAERAAFAAVLPAQSRERGMAELDKAIENAFTPEAILNAGGRPE